MSDQDQVRGEGGANSGGSIGPLVNRFAAFDQAFCAGNTPFEQGWPDTESERRMWAYFLGSKRRLDDHWEGQVKRVFGPLGMTPTAACPETAPPPVASQVGAAEMPEIKPIPPDGGPR